MTDLIDFGSVISGNVVSLDTVCHVTDAEPELIGSSSLSARAKDVVADSAPG